MVKHWHMLVVILGLCVVNFIPRVPPPCDHVCNEICCIVAPTSLWHWDSLAVHTCPDTVYVFTGSDIVAPYEISKIIWEQRANAAWSKDTAHKAGSFGDLPCLIDTTQWIAVHAIDCSHDKAGE